MHIKLNDTLHTGLQSQSGESSRQVVRAPLDRGRSPSRHNQEGAEESSQRPTLPSEAMHGIFFQKNACFLPT